MKTLPDPKRYGWRMFVLGAALGISVSIAAFASGLWLAVMMWV